jgi:hypothetical protein
VSVGMVCTQRALHWQAAWLQQALMSQAQCVQLQHGLKQAEPSMSARRSSH